MRWNRIRFQVRWMLLGIALFGVAMAVYVNERRRRADILIGAQIELLQRAAALEAQLAQEEDRRIARCIEKAEAEERAARSFPKASDACARHMESAGLWRKAAETTPGPNHYARMAQRHRERVDQLSDMRSRNWGRLAVLESMADESRTWLSTSSPVAEELPTEIEVTKSRVRLEREAMAAGRTRFPTSFGPRSSVIEAAAIWNAERFLRATKPNLSLKGFAVEARRPSATQPFVWTVKFTDRVTKRSETVRTSFSPGTVTDYLAKHP